MSQKSFHHHHSYPLYWTRYDGFRKNGRQRRTSVKKEEAVKPEAERAGKEPATKEQFEKSLAGEISWHADQVFVSSLLKDIHFNLTNTTSVAEDDSDSEGERSPFEEFFNVKIQIEGHCDSRGTIDTNLASARGGPTRQRISSSHWASRRSYFLRSVMEGKTLRSGRSEEAWAKNRRRIPLSRK